MRLKKDASIVGIRPEIAVACQTVETVYERLAIWKPFEFELGDRGPMPDPRDCELVLTSGTQGRHSTTSLHYAGAAVDFRTHNVSNGRQLRDEIDERLGLDFDVLFEHDGESNEHLHVEFQPRRR